MMSLLSSWAIVFRTEYWRLLCNQTLLLVAFPVLLLRRELIQETSSSQRGCSLEMILKSVDGKLDVGKFPLPSTTSFRCILYFSFSSQSNRVLIFSTRRQAKCPCKATDRQSPAVHLLKPCLVPFRQRIHSATRWKDVTQQNNTLIQFRLSVSWPETVAVVV